MQVDNDIWGPNADEFIPERWGLIDPNGKQNRAYIPFSAGARVCPAQQMVINESMYILVRFMREYGKGAIVNRDDVEGFVEQHRMQMESRNGVKIAFV